MKKNNLMAILSLTFALVAILILIFAPQSVAVIGCIVGFLLEVAAIVLGFIGNSQAKKKNEKGKGMAIAGIIIGFIMSFVFFLALLGFVLINKFDDVEFTDKLYCTQETIVNQCVDDGNGISNCKFSGFYDIKCTTSNLKSSQMK